MNTKFVIFMLISAFLIAAVYSIPKSAESLRWSTADGYDCETTDNLGSYTCCKRITVVIGGVTLSADRCVDCGESFEGVISCGSPYHVAVSSLDIGGEAVDPKVKNYAKDIIGQGLAILDQGTQEGGQVDPKVKNSANALIGQSLTILTKGGSKGGTVDPKVTKDANVLIDRILSVDKMIIEDAQNIKIPKTGALNDDAAIQDTQNDTIGPNTGLPKDPGLLEEDNDNGDTNVPEEDNGDSSPQMPPKEPPKIEVPNLK
jgi:hypothetical protein